MSKRLLLLSVLGLVIFPHGAKAELLCPEHVPEIEVIPTFGHVEKDRSLRAVNLNSNDAWGDLMVDHIDAKASLKPHNTFAIEKPKKGTEVCVVLSATKILYKLDVTLKVVDDYPKDSCEYKETAAHEERHIAVAKDFLAQTSPMLRQYLLDNLKTQASLASYSYLSSEAEERINQTMNNILDGYVQYLQQEHKKAQREVVDIPSERSRITAACPDWKHPHAYK